MIEESLDRKLCCGCGACSQICPTNAITMVEDEEGFLYPQVSSEKCVNCGLCDKACPVLHAQNNTYEKEQEIKAYGGYHQDEEIRKDSSSGGAFSLFAQWILKQGGKVYGCTLNEKQEAFHIGISSEDELYKLRGSKYVQSEIGDVYKEIKQDLEQDKYVFFVGTPCQAGGLHSFLGKKYEKLYICDFICHGVPSRSVFRSYIDWVEKTNNDKVVGFRFRNKDKGWSQTGLQLGTNITLESGKEIRKYPCFQDAYMNGFLDDIYLRPACYQCSFKSLPKYYTDFTIADFWGVDKVDKSLNDQKGTSLILVHSQHGQELFDLVNDSFKYKECDFEKAISRNKVLVKSAKQTKAREGFYATYKNAGFNAARKKYMTAIRWIFNKSCRIAWSIIEKIIRKCMSLILKPLKIEWDDAKWESFFQFVKFCMVGVTNTFVSYFINVLTLFLLSGYKLSYDYYIANVVAFLISVYWSFCLNSRFVFTEGRRSKVKTLLKSYMSYALTGIVINNILSTLWVGVLGVSKYIAPMFNLLIAVPINFLMNKKWAYKSDTKEQECDAK